MQCRFPISGSASWFCDLFKFGSINNSDKSANNINNSKNSDGDGSVKKGNSRTLIVHFSLNQRLFQLNHDTIRLRARLTNTSAKAIHGVKIVLRQLLTFYTETAQVTIENTLLLTSQEEHIEPQTNATV